ncbi:monofunctional biosynthetic peptidoglycan transglycosylase [Phyllobacterium endophyticum]|uniref:monofunctional biosynthetic peptidoglycan transglycosylase n=1 Tax=Phyllobacterium endophyticum TaxID=1149773 RepID=UPI001FEED29F|nr:monofunctional biosynthetic peptidoglycan transglycosylase [Phyllobacterium endophyticum]
MARVLVRNKRGRGFLVDPGRSPLGRAVRYLILAGIVLIMVPILLLTLYRLPFVHPVSTLMVKDLVTFSGYDRRWVSLDQISPTLVNSVMMSEDARFCFHNGVDWEALNSVVSDTIDGEQTRGASTIPMQTAKNLFLWTSRSFIRKGLEVPLAVLTDLILPKRRLMEVYLNIAEWGPGIYGIEAAAQHHFKVSAAKLQPRQAAYLAVTLPNPIVRNPAKPGRGMQTLARVNERRARGAGAYVGCVK